MSGNKERMIACIALAHDQIFKVKYEKRLLPFSNIFGNLAEIFNPACIGYIL